MNKLGTLLFEKSWIFLVAMMALIGLFWPRLFWPLSIGGASILGGVTALLTGKLPYGGRRPVGVREGPAAYVGGAMLIVGGLACIVWFSWLR